MCIRDRNETDLERIDRNLSELLGELRVALPGVQVLFAFLLIVPFTARFATLSAFDRDLQELLGELRVALPGVQVLFAFLLVVPFQQRFADITSFQRTTYFVTLLLATGASACLIAPTAHHRIEFRAQDKTVSYTHLTLPTTPYV